MPECERERGLYTGDEPCKYKDCGRTFVIRADDLLVILLYEGGDEIYQRERVHPGDKPRNCKDCEKLPLCYVKIMIREAYYYFGKVTNVKSTEDSYE